MELMSRLRWIIIICVVAVAFILLGWAFYSIARGLFNVSDGPETSELVDQNQDVLATRTATLYVEGPIVANSEHRSYSITVSENVVTMKVYAEYGDKVISSKSYTNTPEAYSNFISALDRLGVEQRVKDTDTDDDFDSIGVCAKGRTYIIELDSDIRRWSTSCRDLAGTAGFSMSSARSLFQNQVPDHSEMLEGISLR